MNLIQGQNHKSLPVETVQNAQKRLIAARQRCIAKFGPPSVMFVGAEIYAQAFPVHDFPHPAEAIEGTLVVPNPKLPSQAVVVMKPVSV